MECLSQPFRRANKDFATFDPEILPDTGGAPYRGEVFVVSQSRARARGYQKEQLQFTRIAFTVVEVVSWMMGDGRGNVNVPTIALKPHHPWQEQ